MRRFSRFLTAATVATGLLPAVAFGQLAGGALPADVTAPRPDDGSSRDGVEATRDPIPTRLSSIVLPQVQFLFDDLLDPQRISLIETVNEGYTSDPRLTEAARSVIRNHMAAMQQVQIAIQFLQANREDILSGNNTEFNQVFGNIGELRPVAVTDPNPIGGTFTTLTVDPLTGFLTIRFQDQSMPTVVGDVQPGDFVFVGDAPNNDPLGFLARVVEVRFDPDYSNQELIVEPIATGGRGTIRANARPTNMVYRVRRFEEQADTARYDRVLQTFEAIADALAGLDPGLAPALQIDNAITYNRRFTDINNIYTPGIAPFTPLDGIVQGAMSATGLNSTRTADRLVRQDGFSTSDSHFHLDRLEDQGNSQATDYQGRATFPLLWTEDNELPLNFRNNQVLSGATDEDRAFFRDRQTIFGEPDNPFVQYLGRAFFDETINHASEFFDTTVAVDPGTVAVGVRESRRPARGALFDLNGNGILRDPEDGNLPESGDEITEDTEFRRWQMIIESFAEHSSDLTQLNVAAIGIGSMFGSIVPESFRAQDASNYAVFAGLLSGGSISTINPTQIEPFGKRGTAGFEPVIPRN